MPTPYRTPPEAPIRPAPPRELSYHARDLERYAAPRRTILQAGLLACAALFVARALGHPAAGAIIAMVCAAVGIARALRSSDLAGSTFRVEDGELRVSSRGETLLALPLESLLEVELDTKQIQRGRRDTRIAVALIADGVRTTVDPEIDVARIVLVPTAPREPVTLTDAYISHMEAVEWASKIRVFLRAHGWLPEGEREPPEGPPSPRGVRD